jgi:hypothetical protein
VSIDQAEVDDMLLREFDRAAFNNRRAEMARLSTRALDKVLAEFLARGFAGFRVTEIDGQLHVDGLSRADIEIPVTIRSAT